MKTQALLNRAIAYCDSEVTKKLPYLVRDKESADFGGLFVQSIGFCSPTHVETAGFIRQMGYSYCSKGSRYYNDKNLYERIFAALDFVSSKVHESGFIDLRDRNYDSPPDTAFFIGCLYPIAWLAKNIEGIDRGNELYEKIRPIVVRSAKALAENGGFHTPNHRWIIMGALAGAADVFPELEVNGAIEEYLGEKIDLNGDGIYSEKSILYSAHINHKLLDAYYYTKDGYLADCVVKNCRCILDFMNSDTSILTSISIRQDNGRKVFPTEFISSFYFAAKRTGDARFYSAIDAICRKNTVDDEAFIYILARNPEWINDEIDAPEFKQSEVRFLSDTGVWAYNRDELDVFMLGGVDTQLCIRFGDVFLKGIKIFAPYFSNVQHLGCDLTPTEKGAKMTTRCFYSDEQSIHMPGYWKPLGREVTFKELPYNNLKDRERLERPSVSYTMDLEKTDRGFDLTVSSEGGVEGAHFALQFDFELGGTAVTESTFEKVDEQSEKLLTKGYMAYRRGVHSIKIGPGFFEHAMAAGTKNAFSVSMTANLPFKKTVHIELERLDGKDATAFYTI
ncbi:MAG: hypothetical protein IKA74_02410 [Clostridia bacterium]|nr:hypothetical protein [Clostridia bacterium]